MLRTPEGPSIITSRTSPKVGPTKATLRQPPCRTENRVHSAPARVFPAPRPPMNSHVRQRPFGGRCAERAVAKKGNCWSANTHHCQTAVSSRKRSSKHLCHVVRRSIQVRYGRDGSRAPSRTVCRQKTGHNSSCGSSARHVSSRTMESMNY